VHARAVNLRRDTDASGIPTPLRWAPRLRCPTSFGWVRTPASAGSRRALLPGQPLRRRVEEGPGTGPTGAVLTTKRFGVRRCLLGKTPVHLGERNELKRVRSGACRQRCRRDDEGGKALFVRRTLKRKEAQEGTDLPRLATTEEDTRPEDGARPRSRRSGTHREATGTRNGTGWRGRGIQRERHGAQGSR